MNLNSSLDRARDTESTIISVQTQHLSDAPAVVSAEPSSEVLPQDSPREATNASPHSAFASFLRKLSASYPLPHETLLFPLTYLLFYFSVANTKTNRSTDANGFWCNERFYSSYETSEQERVISAIITENMQHTDTSTNAEPDATTLSRASSPVLRSSVLNTPQISSSESSVGTDASVHSQLPFLLPLHRMRFTSFLCSPTASLPLTFLSIMRIIIHSAASIIHSVFSFINNWIDLVFLIIMYLQLASHIHVPVLSWSKITTRWLVRLAFLRSFQLETLFLDPIDFSHPLNQNTALWMNFYAPLIGAFVYLILLYINFAHCALLTFLTRNKVVEQFSGVRYWYMRVSFFTLHVLFRLLPLLYMPTLNAFFLAITCNLNWHVRLEVIPQNCWSTEHFALAIAALFSLAPFIAISFFGVSVTNDWRPDTRNVCGKPHTRYDMITFAVCTLIVFMSSFLESLTIFLLFIDFTLILILIGLHIYFMQWYKTFVNQLVCTFLIVTMFGCMIALLISAFHFIFSFFEFSFTNFPGAMLFAAIPVSFVLGMKLTMLRLNVIRLSLSPLTAPRPLQLLYNIEPHDVIVPRGEFEIEMASRSLPIVRSMVYEAPSEQKMSDQKRTWLQRLTAMLSGGARISPRPSQDDALLKPSEEETFQHEQEERVRDMFQNSLDMASHSRSEYIHISFAAYQAHIMNDLRQALHMAEICQTDHTVLWPDFRLMYYVRQRYWRCILDFRQKRFTNHTDDGSDFIPNVAESAQAAGIDLRSLTQLHQRRTQEMAEEARLQREATSGNV